MKTSIHIPTRLEEEPELSFENLRIEIERYLIGKYNYKPTVEQCFCIVDTYINRMVSAGLISTDISDSTKQFFFNMIKASLSSYRE